MKIMRKSLLTALLVLQMPVPVKADTTTDVMVGLAIGTAVVLGTYVYCTMPYTCPGCHLFIDKEDVNIAYRSCGHKFHRQCYTPHHCNQCTSDAQYYENARRMNEANELARQQQEERRKRAQIDKDAQLARDLARQENRNAYGSYYAPRNEVTTTQQIALDAANALKIAEQEKKAADQREAQRKAQQKQEDEQGRLYAQKLQREEDQAAARTHDQNQRNQNNNRETQEFLRTQVASWMSEKCSICDTELREDPEQDNVILSLTDLMSSRYATHTTCLGCPDSKGKHRFHTACLKNWSGYQKTCPNCRAVFTNAVFNN